MSYSLTVICITPLGNPAAFAWTYGLDPFGSIRCTATSNGMPLVQTSSAAKQHPAHRWPGGGGITGHWIEKRGLNLGATDELACEPDENECEIAGSETVAMALLTADHPPLRVQERLGPFPVAVN